MTVLRLILLAVAGWLIWSMLARRTGGSARTRTGRRTPDATEERYRELTDQPIEDAEFEDISRE